MNTTLLINPADIKTLTRLSINFSDDKLSRALLKAQRRELKPILGKHLFDKLTGDVDSSTAFTGDYLILFDEYIYPFLIASTEFWVTKEQFSSVSDNGLGQLAAGTNYNPLSKSDYNAVIEELQAEMDSIGKFLVEYLRDKGSSTFAELGMSTDIPSDEADLEAPRNRSPFIINKNRGQQNYFENRKK